MPSDDRNHTFLTPEVAGDTFTTLLYSNAVGLLIKLAVEYNNLRAIILALGMISFLFFDWVSRVWLPWRLPPTDIIRKRKNFIQLQKTFLEVTGIFCLAVSFALFLPCGSAVSPANHQEATDTQEEIAHNAPGTQEETNKNERHNSVNLINLNYLIANILTAIQKTNSDLLTLTAYVSFSFFLFFTFLWNLLMLYVMEDMSYKGLLVSILKGNALDSEDVNVYGKHLVSKIEEINVQIEKLVKPTNSTLLQNVKNFPTLIHPYFLKGILNSFSQIFAIHMTFTNIAISILVITSYIFFNGSSIIDRDWITTALSLDFFSYIAIVMLLLCILLVWKSTRTLRQQKIDGDRTLLAIISVGLLIFSSTCFLSELYFLRPYLLFFILGFGTPTICFITSVIIESEEENSQFSNFLRSTGSIFLLFITFFSYLLMPARIIIVFILLQQFLVTIFASYSARPIKEH
ncbi:MAG: hypothetical protein MUO63_12395 [Desulfobulbaceae bacterium]|nr:hypothetical protein [Desulfobulbaceae bacterium]